MIEFALVLPLLISLFPGVVFFGRDLFTYNELEERVRSVSRFASIQSYDSLNSLDPPLSCASCMVVLDPAQSRFARRVRDFLVYGTPSPGGTPQPLVDGLTGANVKVTCGRKQLSGGRSGGDHQLRDADSSGADQPD